MHVPQDTVDRWRRQWSFVRPEVDTRSMESIGRLLRVGRHLTLLSDEVLTRYGVTRGEFEVLALLRCSASGLSPTDVSTQLIASKATITKRMKRLLEAGMILRSPSTADGRAVVLTLTSTGVDLVDEAIPVQLGFEQDVLAVLDADEKVVFERFLRRVLAGLEAHEQPSAPFA
jgi:DNA-binding MarR family transcriptional regulator